MKKRELTVTNALGIHARPASMIVKTATPFSSTINLIKDNVTADAKSIMAVMMLAAAQHSKITIKAHGIDEDEALASLVELFENKFNEE